MHLVFSAVTFMPCFSPHVEAKAMIQTKAPRAAGRDGPVPELALVVHTVSLLLAALPGERLFRTAPFPPTHTLGGREVVKLGTQ